MEINKNSWHYRYLCWIGQTNNILSLNNSCSYVKVLIFGILLAPFILIFKLLDIYIFKNEMCKTYSYDGSHFLYIYTLSILSTTLIFTIYIGFSSLGYLIYNFELAKNPYSILDNPLYFILFSILLVILYKGYKIISRIKFKFFFKNKKRKVNKTKKSIFKEYIKNIKEKTCTPIRYVD